MYVSIAVILYLLLMATLWSTQGLFSAFIHLVIVLVAGTIAFSLWEPISVGLIMPWLPHMAWSLGLLIPFAVLLIGLRTMADTVVPSNIRLPGMVNTILGGMLGVISGWLTAGIAIIGFGFMPLSADLFGYQPYVINADGTTSANSDLWVEVDTLTNDVFQMLSNGAMASATPMAVYQPDLREQSSVVRLKLDEYASMVAGPEAVTVENVVVQDLPTEELPAASLQALPVLAEGDQQLVIVDLKIVKSKGTFDGDSTLRLPPTHVRLLAGPPGQSDYVPPIAFSRLTDPRTGERVLVPIDNDRVSADGAQQEQVIAWAFVIPARDEARFIMVRNIRLPLNNSEADAVQAASLLGMPENPEPEVTEPAGPQTVTEAGDRQGIRTGHVADLGEVTASLPRPISRNAATGLDVRRVDEEYMIFSGNGSVKKPQGVQLSRRTRVTSFYVPDHMGMVRVRLDDDGASSLLGRARASAASLQGIWLVDDRGTQWFPHAYVLSSGDGTQNIKCDPEVNIRSARELPLNELGDDDELYLYFQVPKGTEIVEYHVGRTIQDLRLNVE
ncbi:CvpA family protein [Mucisphaera calidilacus]|uniref:Colicin V production protein n=1 Tax=Mucisphaera calidilacus TaxID=2527982 RepID=A0A518BTH2_9BACT|nr:CvpA family protein [Mucisphaera calidilacus]QDU70268.1 hypothetical protein Pan265_00910 [Mucisphaera calidilacus]